MLLSMNLLLSVIIYRFVTVFIIFTAFISTGILGSLFTVQHHRPYGPTGPTGPGQDSGRGRGEILAGAGDFDRNWWSVRQYHCLIVLL